MTYTIWAPQIFYLMKRKRKEDLQVKYTTAFFNFLEKTKIGKDTIVVSMDVSSLYTNIRPEEGTNVEYVAY